VSSESVGALHEQWQRLVEEYSRARHDANRNGLHFQQLRQLDMAYNLRIDLAFTELRIAESLERLRQTVQQARRLC